MARLGRRFPVKPHYNSVEPPLPYKDYSSTNLGDTYIRQDLPSTNQGATTTSSIQWYQPFLATNHTLIQFLLNPTNKGSIIEIRLYLYFNGGVGGSDCDCYLSSSTFTEGTVTWTLAPAYTTNIDTINDGSATVGWRYWVLRGTGATNSQTQFNWGSTISLHLRYTTESGATKSFGTYTKEYTTDPSLQPYIEITYIPNVPNKDVNNNTNFAITRAANY